MSARAAAETVGLTGDLPGQGVGSQPELFGYAEPVVTGADRGPGRPRGARNKATKEWIDYLQRQYGDPREALAKVMATPIAQLKEELAVDRGEAAEFWLRATLGLLPYMAGKPAVEVAVQGNVAHLHVFAGAPGAATELPPGGVVGLLEQAAAQARAEGFDGSSVDAEFTEVSEA